MSRFFLAIIVSIGLLWFLLTVGTILSTPIAPLQQHFPISTAYMELSEKSIRHHPVPLSQIALPLRQAVVVAEDSKFYDHFGVDWEAVKEAAKINWKRKSFSHGGSTLTMQLARNLFLSPNKTPLRKFRELLIALKMEALLSKDRILELYLNAVEWGDGIFGAEAAAKHYFGISAEHVSLDQAAFLAAILPRPRYYDSHRNSAGLKRRTEWILNLLGGRKEEEPLPLPSEENEEPPPEVIQL